MKKILNNISFPQSSHLSTQKWISLLKVVLSHITVMGELMTAALSPPQTWLRIPRWRLGASKEGNALPGDFQGLIVKSLWL